MDEPRERLHHIDFYGRVNTSFFCSQLEATFFRRILAGYHCHDSTVSNLSFWPCPKAVAIVSIAQATGSHVTFVGTFPLCTTSWSGRFLDDQRNADDGNFVRHVGDHAFRNGRSGN